MKGVAGYRFVQDFNQARLQEADGEKSPKELSEAIFGPFDYAGFLDREANGKVPNGQGEVPGSSPADILTNMTRNVIKDGKRDAPDAVSDTTKSAQDRNLEEAVQRSLNDLREEWLRRQTVPREQPSF